MKKLSLFINENSNNSINNSISLLRDDIVKYNKMMSGKLPKKVSRALFLIEKYPFIKTKEDILNIKNNNLKLYAKLDILPDDLKELQTVLKSLGSNINMLPHFLTNHQRQALELNRLSIDDIILDLETNTGREETAKRYVPLVMKIVYQYLNKSSLNKSELMSAGMEGLVKAMNSYKTSDEMEIEGKKTTMTFKQYAAYRIKFAIISAMNNSSSVITQSAYYKNKDGAVSTLSIDRSINKEEDIMIDRILSLSEEPDYELKPREEKQWPKVFNTLEKKFSSRDCNIFYRSFGINGFEKEQGKVIAKTLNVSAPYISQVIKKIINFLRQDEESLSVLHDILSIYECQLLVSLINSNNIFEDLVTDNIYILLESSQWNISSFKKMIENATNMLSADDAILIFKSLEYGTYIIADKIKSKRSVFIHFLEYMYPTERINKLNNNEIINKFEELHIFNKNFNIKW